MKDLCDLATPLKFSVRGHSFISLLRREILQILQIKQIFLIREIVCAELKIGYAKGSWLKKIREIRVIDFVELKVRC